MLFAALVLEHEPPRWGEFPAALVAWAQTAGTVAALGLGIWLLAYGLQHPKVRAFLSGRPRTDSADSQAGKPWSGEVILFALGAGLTGILYVLALLAGLASFVGSPVPVAGVAGKQPVEPTGGLSSLAWQLFTLASGAALLTVALAPLLAIRRLSARRIWALARLSLKEAIHSRVVLVFSFVAVLFLFLDWFVSYKPEDQLRNYVWVIQLTLLAVFLMTVSILGAFSIPNDLRRQSIHTIVTKPVERFEIFLGRFLGFGLLATAGLAVLAGLSLIYLVRGVTEDSAQESYKARIPIFGDLTYWGTAGARKLEEKGVNVGRIWNYRGYISGKDNSAPYKPRQLAVWAFDELPQLGAQANLRVEFTFDIFRLAKGAKERAGMPCTFIFAHGSVLVQDIDKELTAYRDEEASLSLEKSRADLDKHLIANYRMFVKAGQQVVDYHTQALEVPRAFFELVAAEATPAAKGDAASPLFRVFVAVDDEPGYRQTQMLGMARRDLYLLPAIAPFELNFLKGMIGLWCLVLLVLGLALALSTYLSGVIAWLATMVLVLLGVFRDFIQQIAMNLSEGGGPAESSFRLAKGRGIVSPLDPTPGLDLVKGFDDFLRWVLRLFVNIVPDVDRFDLQEYVASGFDISWSEVLLLNNLLPLVAYLVPCFILAFYLLRFREIANPN